MGKMQIISDGTARGTEVLVDGEHLENVMSVIWDIDSGGIGNATLVVRHVPATIQSEMDNTRIFAADEQLQNGALSGDVTVSWEQLGLFDR